MSLLSYIFRSTYIKTSFLLFLFLFLSYICSSQILNGNILGTEEEPLVGATVNWLGTTLYSSTNENGQFQISKEGIERLQLVVSFVGYASDTIAVLKNQTELNITLIETTLGAVEVNAKRQGSYISSIDPIKTEVISEVELSKAACCDLAGCFGTEASVSVITTNIVTNAKELRILGLSGVYNQLLVDGLPLLNGLSYTYGVSAIPGTLVKKIYVSKGSNSVLQGFESMVGQINVILKEPDDGPRLFLNAYINSFLEKQFNVNYRQNFKDWNALFAVHTTQPANRIDQDEDQFMDLPLLSRYTFYNKWKKGNEAEWGFHSKIGFRFVNEERVGGQLDFDQKNEGTTLSYGQTVKYNQPEIYTKTGFRMDDIHHFVFLGSAFYQKQKAYYGITAYQGEQQNIYANLQYELTWKEKNTLKTGLSYRYQKLEEDITFNNDPLNRSYAGNYLKKESIPGLFAENTSKLLDDDLVIITGIRADFHNEFGAQVTPRALVKYQVGANTTMRGSIGIGWRTTNLLSENINLLASSRDIIFTETLKPEKSINFGFNVVQKMVRPDFEAWFSLDVYRTRFFNQIFPDYNVSPTQAIISNFEGTSIGNGVKAEMNVELFKVFNSKIAYNYLDVYRKINNNNISLPFIPTHKLIGSFSYQPTSNKWHFDVNIHWYGQQGLTNTNDNPPEFQLAEYSDPYTVFNAQFTKTWKRLELYLGCENIFDFRQEKAILSWQNPFGAYFDTASVWGPTRGREFYLGLRYTIEK